MAQPVREATVQLAERLSDISAKHLGNPFATAGKWPEKFVPGEDWHTSPELISLEGTADYERMSEAERKKLSFFEAINFYSLNIHGERSLMEGLAARLYRKWPGSISTYIHHFLGEENNHMVLFGGFCMRFAGKVYPDRHMIFPREYAPGEEDFLFFAKVLVFEEIVDHYNYVNARDEKLHPVAREINTLHRFDEARHLAFGRKMVADLFAEYSPKWTGETLAALRGYLANYIVATLREYANPDVYRDVGLSAPHEIPGRLWEEPSARERRKKATSKLRHFLLTNQILTEEPEL